MKKSFVMYADTYDSIKALSQKEKGNLLDALFQYAIEGKETALNPVTGMAFSFIKKTLDRDTEKWNAIRDRNIQNGKNGGRPKKGQEKPKKPTGYSGNPKNLVSVNVNVNDNETTTTADDAEVLEKLNQLLGERYQFINGKPFVLKGGVPSPINSPRALLKKLQETEPLKPLTASATHIESSDQLPAGEYSLPGGDWLIVRTKDGHRSEQTISEEQYMKGEYGQ